MKSKLAYLCSSQSWGGLEMNHIRNAKWMADLGYDTTVICVAGTPIEKYAQELNLTVHTIVPHKKYYDFKQGKILSRYLSENDFTHLLIRSTYDMSITAIVKRKLKDKIHTSYFMEMQLGVKKTNFLHTLRFKGIDLWSCPLNWLEEQVNTMTRFSNKTVVIPSGLDLSQFDTIVSQEEARKALDLPRDAMIFGLIGRFDPQKGQLLLLEAMEKSKHKDYHVVLLGEPTKHEGEEYFEKMERVIQNELFKDRVHVRPFMKEVTTFFSAVDWFVMATKAETFGMVTIESLAAGTPVLGSNAGGTPEILQEGKGGRLFSTQNSTDLAKQIDAICGENLKIEARTLQNMAKVYDHNVITKMVAEELNLVKN